MKITLKKWNLDHIDDYSKTLKWFTDPEVMKFIGFYKKCKDFKTEREALDFSKELKDGIFFGIYADSTLIGQTTFSKINGDKCEFGIIIGEKDYWGKGIGAIVTKMMLTKAKEMGFKKVNLTTASKNIAAQKVYNKVGFKKYCRIKNDRTIFCDGGWILDDTIEMFFIL